MSQDVETAYSVGMRHDMKPCILKIDAKQAWKEGIVFYYGNEKYAVIGMVGNEKLKEIAIEYQKAVVDNY